MSHLDRIIDTEPYEGLSSYKEPSKIEPPKSVEFAIEPRERFWKDDDRPNFVYELDGTKKPIPTADTLKPSEKPFDFKTELVDKPKRRSKPKRDLDLEQKLQAYINSSKRRDNDEFLR